MCPLTHPVIELQAADTMADQLRHRRENLAEREQLVAARNALVRWDQARIVARKRLDELADQITTCETTNDSIDSQRERLEAQMKTIIAPKEAEALQHELAALDERRSANDDTELTAMEEQAKLEEELGELAGREATLRDEYLAADAALNVVARDIDAELARIDDRRRVLRDTVDAKVLKRYDQMRTTHLVAAAPLSGSRCDGCHLDLSAAELDTVKKMLAKDGVTECPQCGRLLVA